MMIKGGEEKDTLSVVSKLVRPLPSAKPSSECLIERQDLHGWSHRHGWSVEVVQRVDTHLAINLFNLFVIYRTLDEVPPGFTACSPRTCRQNSGHGIRLHWWGEMEKNPRIYYELSGKYFLQVLSTIGLWKWRCSYCKCFPRFETILNPTRMFCCPVTFGAELKASHWWSLMPQP